MKCPAREHGCSVMNLKEGKIDACHLPPLHSGMHHCGKFDLMFGPVRRA